MSQSDLVRRAGSLTRDPVMSEKITKKVCEYMSSLAFVVFSCLHKGFTRYQNFKASLSCSTVRQMSLHLLLFSFFTRTILNLAQAGLAHLM